jgi:Ser/Thr protein kinase RdoA (MazF antagonist)
MMRLSTLWRVDATIDGDGRSPVADQLLERWPHDPGSARFTRSSANFVYRFSHHGLRRYLRFADNGERRRAAIEAEVALVAWLGDVGLTVARPLRSRAGMLVETMETAWGSFHAVVFTGLGGEHRAMSALDDAGFAAWGAALGRLHATMRRYPGVTSVARGDWRALLAFVRAHIPPKQTMVEQECDDIEAILLRLPVSADHYGLIHFDFELDNLCWRDDTIGMLDFDDCAFSWYVADIAYALRDLFDTGATLDHPSFQAFVRGYRGQHRLDDDLLAQIPLFLRLSKLLQYARLVRSLDLPAAPDQPAWLAALRFKFEQRVAAHRALLSTELE